MNPFEIVQNAFLTYLQSAFSITQDTAHQCGFTINVDFQKKNFGDLNSSAPLVLAKLLGKAPQIIAQEIRNNFNHPYIEQLSSAGPGFLNATMRPAAFQEFAQLLFEKQVDFFKSPLQERKHYLIEFVSANPTGPLHLGNGRGGIIGDVLGNILHFLGHQVTKEFYINDAGVQMEKLGASLKVRCQQLAGQEQQLPEDGYQGTYLVDIAKKLTAEYEKNDLLEQPESFFAQYAKNEILVLIKKTLQQYGIHFDSWFSEKTLHGDGSIEQAIKTLDANGYLYHADGALWIKTTLFGDDKDRVIQKSNGQWTYITPDIAYLQNKIKRGATHLILIIGHDHHSFAIRLEIIRKALGITIPLDIILYQLVKIKSYGELVRMSKRAGSMVTLDDVIEAVGTDVARFFYLHRKADAQLEFDLDLALQKTEKNPVYYLQYAYVRINSILAKAAQQPEFHALSKQDVSGLEPNDFPLLRKIAALKVILQSIAQNHQTHLLTYYALELADLFHNYYAHERIISENTAQTRARLLLLTSIQVALTTVFDLLGISKPERM